MIRPQPASPNSSWARQGSLRSSGVTSPASRKRSAKAAAKRPQTTESAGPCHHAHDQFQLQDHSHSTGWGPEDRCSQRVGRSESLRSFLQPLRLGASGPSTSASRERRDQPALALSNLPGAREPRSTDPQLLPAAATGPCRTPRRPPAMPALPTLSAGPRAAGDSGDLRRPRQDPLSSLCSVPAPRKLRPSPATRAYPCWRLRGLPATGELEPRREDFFF